MSQRPNDPSGGLTPDELEQRQRPDGSLEDAGVLADEDLPDHPLSADELEQRQVVEEDEDDRRDA